MEIDQLKSPASEDQTMEMNQMMMPPDFFGAFTDVLHSPTVEFAAPHFLDNPNLSASSFLNLPTSSCDHISFTRVQEHVPRRRVSPPGELSAANSTQNKNSMAAMREMIFRIAAMQPIQIDPESVKPPKRRNVKISKDPQSVAARHRRERISERIRILQRLVPGGTKMDTASMLDEAIHYVKFLKTQVQSLERASPNRPATAEVGYPVAMCGNGGYLPCTDYQVKM